MLKGSMTLDLVSLAQKLYLSLASLASLLRKTMAT
uniref:Uncharacterized protein n=1 Tax=Rhizophora mucronata TaxID=61149 RepID=A0A2P2P428_RHIMU